MSEATKKRFEDPVERDQLRQVASNISDETRARMSAAQKRRLADPAERQKLSALMLGKSHTEETKAKISAARSGVPKSDITLANMRVAQRMKPPRGLFKGVSVDNSKWRAIICIDGRNRHLGAFSNPEEAAMAYDHAAKDAWGVGNCYLNFPVAANDNEAHSQAINA